jgi:hypothetical protein
MPHLFEVQRQWLIELSRVPLGHPCFLVIKSLEGLCNLFTSWICLQKEHRHPGTVIVVIIDEISRSGFQKDIPAGMWIYGSGNVRVWVNTLHVLIEALLGKQLGNGPCQWIMERWNGVAENRWTTKAAQVHRNTPANTKSQITYIPCPSDGCNFFMPKHWRNGQYKSLILEHHFQVHGQNILRASRDGTRGSTLHSPKMQS